MLKGKYTIQFVTPAGKSVGFVIAKDGEMIGGDSNYIYDGAYYKRKGKTQARILISSYSGVTTSTFGPAKYFWLKATYRETNDGRAFGGKGVVINCMPDIPGVVGSYVSISGKRLE